MAWPNEDPPVTLPEDNMTSSVSQIDFTGPLYKILNLTDGEPASVNKDSFSAGSKFFRRAIKANAAALRDDPYTKPALQRYFYWIQSRKIAVPRGYEQQHVTLAHAYAISELIKYTKFKNAIINSFIVGREETELPEADATNIIYNNTPPHSPARRLMADFCAYYVNFEDSEWTEILANCHSDYLLDVIVIMKTFRDLLDDPPRDPGRANHTSYQ
ncbi:hypothetical protein P154DRAFT_576116 [Amniculicola lignicola CBS 123094]|uniref:BTB domain-containing protein n=1 Tax=Amniculicola lignicola CBS 123094 TaxID=1392246 RepID=A0A6A5WI03_9PLEO|nr:hypothetical protein P154DRAFT_576116 [Amniculicola lignicola CBS 123094]